MAGAAPPPRRRILDAALVLAAEGGFDAIQVRAIAERASVSSRTIYEQFSSLESLLIFAIAEQASGLYVRYTETPPRGATAEERVDALTRELSQIMTANRTLTVALLRALLCGKPDVSEHVRNFVALTENVIAAAISPDGPTTSDREAAEMLERIWFTGLIGWAIGFEVPRDEIMYRATRRLLGKRVRTPQN
jgi:AcrR family transcriptional regulator